MHDDKMARGPAGIETPRPPSAAMWTHAATRAGCFHPLFLNVFHPFFQRCAVVILPCWQSATKSPSHILAMPLYLCLPSRIYRRP